MENKFRKAQRLAEFDYNSAGTYFLTICVQNKLRLLSRIVGGDVLDAPQTELTLYGKIADKYINQLNDFYHNISVDSYVIMPNHIHILLSISDDGASRTSPPTTKQHSAVPSFVSTFKRFCNKDFGENIWQRSFYDHVIRSREDYEKHAKYIAENPARWRFDEFYAGE